MTSRYNLKNFASGDEYYKSIDFGLNRDLYIDAMTLPNLYRYNLAVQNYWLGTPVIKKKTVNYVKENKKSNKKEKENK